MNFVWTIFIVIVATLGYAVIHNLVLRYLHSRHVAKYDNYERDLNKNDLNFLEQAQADLDAAAEVETPRWYKIFLYTAFVPTMFLCWVVFFGCFVGLQLLIKSFESEANDSLFQTGGELEWAIGAGLFGGIFLAGALLYGVSLRKQALSNFVALNSNASGFDKDAVRNGLMAKLVHKIRTREQKTSAKFSADEFLNQINITYRDVMLKFFYGCMAFALIFAILDLRSGVEFYETEMVGTGKYFTISPEQTITYERITKVELYCYFYKGDAKARYNIFVKDNEFTSLEVNPKTRTSLEAVNAAIRRHNQKSLEAGGDGTRRIPSDLICMDQF